MNEFALMSNALNFTYKALEGKKMDWQCKECGFQQSGHLHNAPAFCYACASIYFEPTAEAEKREAENRIINKQDEFREEELRNGC